MSHYDQLSENSSPLTWLICYCLCRCSAPSSSPNQLSIHFDSGNPDIKDNKWRSAVLVAAGDDPYQLMDTAVAAAAAVTGKHTRLLLICTQQAYTLSYMIVGCKSLVFHLQAVLSLAVRSSCLISVSTWAGAPGMRSIMMCQPRASYTDWTALKLLESNQDG